MAPLLLDTNLIIYRFRSGDLVVERMMRQQLVRCSAFSKVEALGFHAILEEERTLLDVFFKVAVVLAVVDRVIDRAVELRQRRKAKMSLGDAIIAATAIVHGLTLATRNVRDFAWIDELAVVNPYDDASATA